MIQKQARAAQCAALRAALATAALVCACSAALATDRAALVAPQVRAPVASIKLTDWLALSAEQRTFLAPLQADWSSIDGVRQQKWLQLAGRMPALPADERLRIQQRMANWSQLTPEKRNQARLQFIEAQKLPAPQRQARWQEYQALSDDEKKVLVQQAKAPKAAPAGVPDRGNGKTPTRADAKSEVKAEAKASADKSNLVQAPAPSVSKAVTTTALQARPGATTRPLNTPAVPPAHNQPGLPKIAATDGFVDPATLLPKRGPQGAAMRSALTGDTSAKP